MFLPTTKEARPYALFYDRENESPTWFWLRPMDAEEYEVASALWQREERKRGIPDEMRARRKIQVDREQLQSVLLKVEVLERGKSGQDGYIPHTQVTNPEEIAGLIRAMDWDTLQELLTAARRMSILEEGGKNYSGSASNGRPSPSAPNTQGSASPSTVTEPPSGLATTSPVAAPATPDVQ